MTERAQEKMRVERTTPRDDAAAPPDAREMMRTRTAKSARDAKPEAETDAEADGEATAKPTGAEATNEKPNAQDAVAAAAEAALAAAQAALSATPAALPTDAAVAENVEDASVEIDAPTAAPATTPELAATAAALVGATMAVEEGDDGSAPPPGVAPQAVVIEEKVKPQTKIDAVLAKMTEADGTEAVPLEAIAAATAKREQPAGGEGQDQPKDPSTAVVEATKTDVADAGKAATSAFDQMLAKLAPGTDAAQPTQPTATTTATTSVVQPATAAASLPPEQRFAQDNLDNVVTSVRTQATAGAAGGSQMRIRLDPPELGALEVAVKMVNGRMTASFTTSNDQATQLLSHSLDNLKSSLEASGINVDRIQVRQSGNDGNAQNNNGDAQHRNHGNGAYDPQSRQGDQQRREAVNKMWRKLAYGSDEVDLVA